MRPIKNQDELLKNVYTFFAGLKSKDARDPFIELLRNGRVFVAVEIDGSFVFAPSRFIGYAKNSLNLHNQNRQKDGKQTNPTISKIIGEKNSKNNKLETLYFAFCKRFGIQKFSRRKRTFWPTIQKIVIDDEKAHQNIEADIQDILGSGNHQPADRLSLILSRVGQGQFREALLKRWNFCAISGIHSRALLRASHIKPWKHCISKREKLDPENGLLLAAHFDAAFDGGLISFSDDGAILISKKLSAADRSALKLIGDEKVELTSRAKSYMSFHRKLFDF